MSKFSLEISRENWIDLTNIHDGTLAPLDGFMGQEDYRSSLESLKLKSGIVWTIPITLELPFDLYDQIENEALISLNYRGEPVGTIEVSEKFHTDLESDVLLLYGTSSQEHPGVAKELERSPYRIAGRVECNRKATDSIEFDYLSPSQMKNYFQEMGWKTIVGFQTRNPPHLAHEYLQRVGLEIADGLLVHPLIGWKKKGDISPEGVMGAYKLLTTEFYPKERSYLSPLVTNMRYAGPKEAVFHAMIRKNFGCSHFIVGRDHAGVGGFYGKYEAQELAQELESDLGIKILPLAGPYFCKTCNQIVTERTCRHGVEHHFEVSGTQMRKMLSSNEVPPREIMRQEVSQFLVELNKENKLFI